MKKHYKVKKANKIKLKSYLDKNNNKKNERNTRHCSSSNR